MKATKTMQCPGTARKIKAALISAGLLLSIAALLMPAVAQEEVTPGLECTYTGTWSAKGGKGQFNWHVFWFAGDGGWILRGNGNDATGKSHLRAGCGDGACNIRQEFVSGKYKGQTFTYLSKYKGEIPEIGPMTMPFAGTWGRGDSTSNGGSWKASPKCQSKSNIGDLPKVLGWDVWG